MTAVLAPFILAHLVSLAPSSTTGSSASTGPATSALLPVRADALTLDDAPALARLDAALRKSHPALLDVDATNANVAAAHDAGVVCGGNDRACLSKLAALFDVDRVLSAHAARTIGGWHVVITVVDRTARSAEVDGTVGDAGKDARTLLERALSAPLLAPTTSATPSPHTTATATTTVADDDTVHAPTIAGAVLTATGAALITAGAVTTTAMEIALQKPESFADRGGKLFAGQAGVVAVLVGALAAGGGATVLALAP